MKYEIALRIFNGEKCYGPGIDRLLALVDEHGSLNTAAKKQKMAYSKAWSIIKRSELAIGFSLLDSHTGGAKGGGASLTPKARELMKKYYDFRSDVNDAARISFSKHFDE